MGQLDRSFCDEDGLPGTCESTGNWDGGDTWAIVGTLLVCCAWYCPSRLDQKFIDPLTDTPRRHPNFNKWYGKGWRFSRDQLIPLICAGIVCGESYSPLFKKVFEMHRKRWFLTAWNKWKNGANGARKKWYEIDFTGPEIWALWIRMKKPWWRRVILWALDIETLIGGIVWRCGWRTSRVTRNHLLVTIVTRQHSPTLISRLSAWITPFDALVDRWRAHCEAVGEYPTHTFLRLNKP